MKDYRYQPAAISSLAWQGEKPNYLIVIIRGYSYILSRLSPVLETYVPSIFFEISRRNYNSVSTENQCMEYGMRPELVSFLFRR